MSIWSPTIDLDQFWALTSETNKMLSHSLLSSEQSDHLRRKILAAKKCRRSERSRSMSESFDSWHSWHPKFLNLHLRYINENIN